MTREAAATSMRALLVTNSYPTPEDPYPNAFVHRRVKAYQANGIQVEVFQHHRQRTEETQEREFDGVRVVTGNSEALADRLTSSEPADVVLVHFALPDLIQPLVDAGVSAPVIVWIHGFEVETWHRRWFLAIDSAQRLAELLGMKDTHYTQQREFFQWLATTEELDVSFVNVSQWFADMVVEPDIGVPLTRSTVIHNVVDTDVFSYVPKTAGHRREILSIRPYNSPKYANDLAVDAILELSRRPGFTDLSFTIVGRGPMFKELTAPLGGLTNVTLQERLLSQSEIARLHASSGVFLCPTRFDSQGVSMCEAMASGLVPVSSDTAAIPEFVTHGVTGMLGAAEDSASLADAIEALQDPAVFLPMSQAAGRAAAAQCGPGNTVAREIELMRSRVAERGLR